MYASKFTTFPSQLIKSIKAFLTGSLNTRQQAEIRALIGAAADTGTDTIGEGSPVNGVAATATLNPAGANNNIVATATSAGTEGNLLSLQLSIDSATNRTQLYYDKTGPDILVISGDKNEMIVTGTLTDGTDPVVFPRLVYAGDVGGRPSYSNGNYLLQWDDDFSVWQLTVDGGAGGFWASNSDVATPDLATFSFSPPSTGVPTVTASAASASSVIAAINNQSYGVTLANAAANDGTGAIANVAATPLTGGIDQTAVPPYFRVGDGGFYAQEDGVWKKATLGPL